MRNRPVKLNPKLTVLLYVLTRRGGLDRIARATPVLLSPSCNPSLPRSPFPLRGWRMGPAGEISANAEPRPRHPRKLYANCSRKLPRRIISDHRPRPLII